MNKYVKNTIKYITIILPVYTAIKSIEDYIKFEPLWAQRCVELAIAIATYALWSNIYGKLTPHTKAIKLLLEETKNNHYNAEEKQSIEDAKKFTTHLATTENEVREVWAIDAKTFGESTVSVERGIHWWKKANKTGLYVLRSEDGIQGYISIWPTTRELHDDILSGKKTELDIDSADISPPSLNTQEQYWYIGSIVCNHTNKFTVAKLTYTSLKLWTAQIKTANSINICAGAFSHEGEQLLRRFKFSKRISQNPITTGNIRRHYPIYALSVSKSTLLDLLNKEFKKRIKLIS